MLLSAACAARGEVGFPFIRIDLDDTDAWEGGLKNLRFVADQRYALQKMIPTPGFDPDFRPAEKGLDTLCISGSAQFSVPQFRNLAATLREFAGDRTVYIFDLRQESHFFVNGGIPLSVYGVHNWANAGMTHEEVEEDESERVSAMAGSIVRAYTRKDDTPIDEMVINVESAMTEKELVESEGFVYCRLPITDHMWPAAEEIDAFVSFVKGIDPDRVWLHFHCMAGRGRTGVLMVIYDMMRNPDVPMQDIAIRQAMMGSGYALYTTEDTDSYKTPLYAEKARMTPLFYEYVQQNCESGYEGPLERMAEAARRTGRARRTVSSGVIL